MATWTDKIQFKIDVSGSQTGSAVITLENPKELIDQDSLTALKYTFNDCGLIVRDGYYVKTSTSGKLYPET